MKDHIRSRRGVTMLEVVIALTVITLVTVAALSIAMNSTETEAQAVGMAHVSNAAQNSVACFRFSHDMDSFFDTMALTGDWVRSGDTLKLSGPDWTASVTADFSANEIAFSAVNDDGETIYTFTFRKG